MVLALALVVALALVIVPLFVKELRMLAERLPAFLTWVNQEAAPWLKARFAIDFQLDIATVKQLAGSILANNQDLVAGLLGSLRIGGLALIAFFVNVLLVPVVLFFLLRDWDSMLARIDGLIPRHMHARARKIFGGIDAVLAEFLRGQLIVMLVMSVYYAAALSAAGLEFALPVGVITGLLVIVPYIGAFTGILLGTVAAVLQFDSLGGVAWVWVAFGIGQLLEGMAVTPLLVGKRIGLHPVAVIFALLAFGQIFGFFGVLLALPASAALLVTLRHLKGAYLAGSLYGGQK
jgi:predicted PurR-regulated permease PerM